MTDPHSPTEPADQPRKLGEGVTQRDLPSAEGQHASTGSEATASRKPSPWLTALAISSPSPPR